MGNYKVAFVFILFLPLTYSSYCSSNTTVLKGAGSNFGKKVIEQWIDVYLRKHPKENVCIDYKHVGTDKGKKWITGQDRDAEPISFLLSSMPLTKEEQKTYPLLRYFPIVGWAVVLVCNLPGIDSVSLSRELLVDIYLDKVNRWNDRKVLEINPNADFPNKTIISIVRRDMSSSTAVFTKALGNFSSEWKAGSFDDPQLEHPPEGPSLKWPKANFFAWSGRDLVTMVASMPYSIGYASITEAMERQDLITIVTLQNKAGKYIEPLDIKEAVQHVLSEAADQLTSRRHRKTQTIGDFIQNKLIDNPNPEAYPIAKVSYMVLNSSTSPGVSCEEVKALIKILTWKFPPEDMKMVVDTLHLVPIDKEIIKKIRQEIYDEVTCKGRNIMREVREMLNLTGSLDIKKDKQTWIYGEFAIPISIFCLSVIVLLVGILLYYRHNVRKGIANEWLIECHKIKKEVSNKRERRGWMQKGIMDQTLVDNGSFSTATTTRLWPVLAEYYAEVNSKRVLVYQSGTKISPLLFDFETSKYLSKLSHQASHNNVVMFVGITVSTGNRGDAMLTPGSYYLYENPGNYNLHTFLASCPYKLNTGIMYSMALDICAGMKFLHHQGIVHGILDTWTSLLDVNWTVKVSNWAQSLVAEKEKQSVMFSCRENLKEIHSSELIKRLVFRHPDVLKGRVGLGELKRYHDYYSFAMVLTAIFTRTPPFTEEARFSGWKTMIEEVANGFQLPTTRHDIPFTVRNLIKQLIGHTKDINFDIAYSILVVEAGGSNRRGIIDSLMEAMEDYMIKLEQAIEKKGKDALNE